MMNRITKYILDLQAQITSHIETIKSFIYPTNAQLDCSKRMLKFTLKVLLHVSFYTTIIRELAICALLKL
jgi:hypothetical protein